MMMTDPKNDMLDDLFAEARKIAPEPSEALVARVIAEAIPPQTVSAAGRRGLATRLLEMIGGWPAVGGLVAATLAGLWIGVAPPASVEDFTATWFGDPVAVGLLSDDIAFDTGLFADG